MDRSTASEMEKMDPSLDADMRIRKVMERSIIAFALRLAPGVTGLGLTIMRMEFFWVGAMGGASLIAMIFTWPSSERLDQLTEKIVKPKKSNKTGKK
jgi:hypothetical protein